MSRCVSKIALMLALLLPWGAAVLAIGEEEVGWSDTAELGLVATSGNSESFTLGFKNLLRREWEKSRLDLTVGAIYADKTETERFAVEGPFGGRDVREKDTSKTDPERYYFNGLYNRLISEKFYWYAGLDWERNRPAGVEKRLSGSGGVGNIWYDTEDMKWSTDYGVTYTDEEDTTGSSTSYAGLRVRSSYENQLNKSTRYNNELVINENLDETSDFRADFLNAVQVTMTERLALKASLLILYDHEPSYETIPVYDQTVPPPRQQVGDMDVQLDSTDVIFTTSLVVNF